MSFRDFLSKQFIDVIEWVEPEDGILAYRYPMQDTRDSERGQADGPRFADGRFCERRQSGGCLRTRFVHADIRTHCRSSPT